MASDYLPELLRRLAVPQRQAVNRTEALSIRVVRPDYSVLHYEILHFEPGPDFWDAETEILTTASQKRWVLDDRCVSSIGITLTFIVRPENE